MAIHLWLSQSEWQNDMGGPLLYRCFQHLKEKGVDRSISNKLEEEQVLQSFQPCNRQNRYNFPDRAITQRLKTQAGRWHQIPQFVSEKKYPMDNKLYLLTINQTPNPVWESHQYSKHVQFMKVVSTWKLVQFTQKPRGLRDYIHRVMSQILKKWVNTCTSSILWPFHMNSWRYIRSSFALAASWYATIALSHSPLFSVIVLGPCTSK